MESDRKAAMARLQTALGYQFNNEGLLDRALTHSSFAYEDSGHPEHNERLEFLGDAVLKLTTSSVLLEKFPEAREGELTRIRARLVSDPHLKQLAEGLGIESEIRLGRSILADVNRINKPELLANTFEAIIGAIYLDGGFQGADRAVRRLFEEAFPTASEPFNRFRDFKTELQEHCVSRFGERPAYSAEREEGPDHDRRFWRSVHVRGAQVAVGSGRTKKEAEQNAAELALVYLQRDGAGSL